MKRSPNVDSRQVRRKKTNPDRPRDLPKGSPSAAANLSPEMQRQIVLATVEMDRVTGGADPLAPHGALGLATRARMSPALHAAFDQVRAEELGKRRPLIFAAELARTIPMPVAVAYAMECRRIFDSNLFGKLFPALALPRTFPLPVGYAQSVRLAKEIMGPLAPALVYACELAAR
jgi:hypothetical protein